MSWRESSVGEEVRKARRLTRTLKCVSGTCDVSGGNLETTMLSGMLTGTSDSHLSLLPFRIWGNGVSFGPDNNIHKYPFQMQYRAISLDRLEDLM